MEASIMAVSIILKIEDPVWESMYIKLGIYILETGSIILFLKASLSLKMESHILGKLIKENKVRDNIDMLMEIFIKVVGKMILNMEKDA